MELAFPKNRVEQKVAKHTDYVIHPDKQHLLKVDDFYLCPDSPLIEFSFFET